MGRSVFIDLKEEELLTYFFSLQKGKYEIEETRQYPVSGRFDFSIDKATENVENAYLSLPVSSLNFRVIDLPFLDRNRIREILPFELDGIILDGTDRVIFDCVVLGSSGDKYQVLAVYIEKDVVREILMRLKSFDLDPVFVTSVELRNILKDFTLSGLLSPEAIEDKDRISLAVEEMKTPTINLRREEFSYTRDTEKTKKSLRVTAALLICLALVLSANFLEGMISTKYQIASLKNEMRKDYQALFPGEKNIMNELLQLKSHMKELKGKEDLFIGVDPLDVLLKLSRVERQSVVLNEISADKDNISMKGEAPSLSDVQQLKDRLDGLFSGVEISDSKSSAQGKMLFTITARGKRT
jgi:type II secretory pathway component PulL